jgi:hypothetical protein
LLNAARMLRQAADIGASAQPVRDLVTRPTGMNGQQILNQLLDHSWFCMILHVTLTLGDGARHRALPADCGDESEAMSVSVPTVKGP